MLRPGDYAAFLDVGRHGDDPDAFEQNWLSLRSAVVTRVDVTLVMCGGFDNFPPDAPASKHPFMHNRRFGQRSHNDALRAAAAAPMAGPGRTLLFETEGCLRPAHFARDRIHLTAEGHDALSRALLAFLLRNLD